MFSAFSPELSGSGSGLDSEADRSLAAVQPADGRRVIVRVKPGRAARHEPRSESSSSAPPGLQQLGPAAEEQSSGGPETLPGGQRAAGPH
ncbi:hypothetical protein OJAV_G00134360 [Oryzias javanicus]|uniref:Uncharacterized protein n=1 Tax=Oryzias javanicus TaxID=123683 RepID=A0A3S2MDY1_ORYJA|nr:hypothetical protein OJAV_G00134360 [Oryzias javanicus]